MRQEQTFNELKSDLTESDIDDIISVIGKYCRTNTLGRLRSVLTYSAESLLNFGIFNRLTKDDRGWSYCAGQSYPDEIRCLRECILKPYTV